MLKHIKEFRKCVAITGFRNVHIDDFEGFLNSVRKETPLDTEIQFFDAKIVATWEHLYFAALNALTAFKNKESISKSLAIETMLYASAQRQISRAMKLVGVKTHSLEMAVLVIGEEKEATNSVLSSVSKRIGLKPDETVLELTKEKTAIIRDIFEISSVELRSILVGDELKRALADLVIERMALLATQQ